MLKYRARGYINSGRSEEPSFEVHIYIPLFLSKHGIECLSIAQEAILIPEEAKRAGGYIISMIHGLSHRTINQHLKFKQ